MFATMTKKTWRVTAAAALLVGALGAMTYAQQPAPGMGPGAAGPFRGPHGRGMGPFARLGLPLGQLELTDAQRQQIRSIVESHREEMRQLGERTRDARLALRHASEAEAFDENAVRAASNGLSGPMAERAVLHAKLRAEVMQVLTPEQKAKAAEIRTRNQQRMDQRRQRMQGRRQQMQKPQGGAGVGDE